jgi:hypothetical protein
VRRLRDNFALALAAVAVVVTAAVGVAAAVPATSSAYRIDRRIVPQPVIRYYVGLSDWRKPFARVVRALNRAHVGVRLQKAQIPQQATIQIGRLEHRCGFPGVNGATQTIQGGYAAIYLPRGCRPTIGSIIAAHELGHALGLLHENRRCALLNATASGRNGIPTHCQGRRYDWLRHPFRKDDLRGLRKLYRNTPPRVQLRRADGGGQVEVGEGVRFEIEASDPQRNLSEVRIDFGDGDAASGYRARELPRSHPYTRAGTFRVTLTAVDFYGRRDTARVTVRVVPAQ